MPLPPAELAAWRDATVRIDGEVVEGLPLRLQPAAYVVSAEAPQGRLDPSDTERHAGLVRALRQTGVMFTEVELQLGARTQRATLIQGIDRRKAVQLGYKRKQWAVLHLTPQARFVVYTGINSRM